MKKLRLIFILIFSIGYLNAQTPYLEANQKYKLSIVFGLNQPLATQGFNIELNYYTKHFVFDYSHGFNLKIRDNLVSKEAKNQHLKFNIPHSLGFGIGYRITPELNVRIEPKLHIWEVFYENETYQKQNQLKKYNTFTLGLGAYYRWQPFRKKDNFTQGISVIPSLRWWPNVYTNLANNKFDYFNKITNKNETHKANNIGVANSPFFANVSVGYSFGK